MKDYEQEFKQLLKEIGEGSEDAARKFLDEYGGYILRVIRRRLDKKLRSKFDSEDFLQDVWASFFTDPPPAETFASLEALLGFLANLAHNKVAEVHRQRLGTQRYSVNRENSLDGSAKFQAKGLRGAEPTPSEVLVAEEQWAGLVQGLDPLEEKILMLLRHGHTHVEIAHILDIHIKQVQRHIQKMRARFVP